MNKIYHITCVTHNSRTSKRMENYKIKAGEPVTLNNKEEIILTKIISNIVKEQKLLTISYNICADHIHFIIKCEENLRDSIVQRIKSVSAVNFKAESHKGIIKLWAQKFNRNEIDSEEQLYNAAEYIKNNRLKHKLENYPELETIIQQFLTPIEKVF